MINEPNSSINNPTPDQTIIDDGPKLSFLEVFHGVIASPSKLFEELYKEDAFTIFVYGVLAVFLSNLGKVAPENINFLNTIGVELIGFISWFFVGLFIIFFSTVFKTPNNNLARLLGFTGLSSIPYLLMAPIALIGYFHTTLYTIFQVIIGIWSFILFWIALAKSFQLEAWRVFLMAIIPFLLGIFLFTFLIANLLGMVFSMLFTR